MTSTLTGRDVEIGAETIRLYELDLRADNADSTERARDTPTGRPVLWLHGAGAGNGGAVAWGGVLPRLPGFRHLAPDVPGFGHSSLAQPLPRGMAAITKARVGGLIGLLDTLGLDTVDVVGHSMGGVYVLSLLSDHPDRVGRAVLVSSGGAPVRPGPLLKPMITWYQDPTRESLVDWVRDSMAGEPAAGLDVDALVDERMARAMLPGVREAHEATFAREGEPLVYDAAALQRIDREVLVIHGDDDRVLPPDCGRHFGAHIPGARTLWLPRCGHWPHVEHPDAFDAAVASFLHGSTA